MTKKNTGILLVSVIMLVTASVILVRKKNNTTGSNDMLPVALRSIKVKDGWGYEILVDNKVYIHQDFIPAIASFKRFSSESDALLVGNQVLEKIRKGRKPVMTIPEIESAHIHY